MGNVRDFKDLHPEVARYEFLVRSEGHRDFWRKLNWLGARNIRSLPPEVVPDIDATVELTEQEWKQLEEELRQLQ